jgi:molybdenum storage protein
VQSFLMRESLVDKDVMKSTEAPVVRMLPKAHVVKIGGCSILDAGRFHCPRPWPANRSAG